ncbi:hypothetical protein [Ciceribacter sp. L1K22]|uniref:hypothetical protein n=1 Tax=Ciceribacter sp. L1K22 TaxID=2820275 RepID=UPI001ABE80AD|nr:hypothetical protein [Ciceribacter sp. L1K22]MBO3761813.1 hypothetical protein [Ciceribacter sp. L1K22]
MVFAGLAYPIRLAGRHGRIILIAGIVAGVALPSLAEQLAPYIGPLVAILLFLAVLRVGPKAATGALGSARRSLLIVLLLQCFLPVCLALILKGAGLLSEPLAVATLLMMAAAPLSGGPHIVAMTGHDSAPALRLMVLGVAVLPFTVVPVFYFLPAYGSPLLVLSASFKLLAVIALAALAATMVRKAIPTRLERDASEVIDGVSAIAMAVVVVGLMSEVGAVLVHEPLRFVIMLAYVFLLNFGLQMAVALLARASGHPNAAPAIGVVAGNRNMALFLTVLPPELTDNLLFFLGCAQIPIYLTAVALNGFYGRVAPIGKTSSTSPP